MEAINDITIEISIKIHNKHLEFVGGLNKRGRERKNANSIIMVRRT